MNENTCPICSNLNSRLIFAVGAGKLVECQRCHVIYYLPRPTNQELEDFYNSEAYRNQFQESSMAGISFAKGRYQQFEKVLQKFSPSVFEKSTKNLLDIGCGTGDFLQVAMHHGWQVSGTEISPEAAQRISEKIPHNIFVGNLLSIDLPSQNYDVITLYHVIEHLISPNEFLSRIRQLLKPNGVFFVETPNIGGIGFKISKKEWSHLIPPEHITYFNPNSLKFTLNQAGFQDVKTLTISPQLIESLQDFPPLVQSLGKSVYNASSLFNMGPTLQAIACR